MAWNILDAFSDENRARGVLQVVQEQCPDVAVLSEAWHEGKDGLLDDVLDDLNRSGYAAVHGLYEDNDGRQDRHGIMGIVRSELVADQKPQLVSLGSRNAIHVPLLHVASGVETVFDFFGVHLDDRSEQRRLAQTERLVAAADFSGRVVIGGDLNAMYRTDPRAKALRAVHSIVRCLPAVEPRPDFKPSRLRRIGSLASRLTDMATGATLERLRDAGFEDTDPRRQPTKGPFNLDHILVKGLVAFEQHTHDKSPFSDHRAITVSVRAKHV